MLGRLFSCSNKSYADGLLSSKLYDEQTFYPAFMADLQNAKQEVIIESPFITVFRTQTFLPIFAKLKKRGVKIIVNTRHPDEHDEPRARHEAERMVAAMQDAGVKVLYTGRLHRKLVIIDKRIFYEGSLNVLSQFDSCELMRRTDSCHLAVLMLDCIYPHGV